MSEWISVKDRLPDEYPVLAYVNGYGFAESPDHFKLMRITHWMPLPDPPEETKDE